MPCYRPLKCWENPDGTPNFDLSSSIRRKLPAMGLNCGQCLGCRLEHSKHWANRCVAEAQMHQENCFITLTYAPEHLPRDHSLNKQHFQKFLKRLRKSVQPKKIKFFHCGEYGDQLSRPHYHALIFGHDFNDRKLWTTNNGINIDISENLQNLWKFGFTTVGNLTNESAAYVARYATKKITGEKSDEHYRYTDETTGETWPLQPEYITMSRGRTKGEGIGGTWYNKYRNDLFPSDQLVNYKKGTISIPPRYFTEQYKETHPEEFEKIKAKRKAKALEHHDNNSPERLHIRERVHQLKARKLKRTLETS